MINEIGNTPKYQKLLGRLQARKNNKQEGNSDRDIENYAKKHWTDCKGKRAYGTDLEKSYNDGYDEEYYNIMKPRYDSICNSIEKYKQRKNESKTMNKKLIRLTESDLHKIVKESAKRIMKEVALKGKSGKTYSLHGNDEESWDIMTNLRQNQKGGHGVTQYNTSRNAKNAEEMDAKNHPNRRSLNNANRVKASLKRTSDASKDIMAANESKLSRIVKESVNRILKESVDDIEIALGEEYNVNPKAIKQRNANAFDVPIDGQVHVVYVFNDEEEACNYLWQNWDLEDYCEGAAKIDYWKRGCPECFDDNGNPDWHCVAQAVLDAEGPAWFFDGYDGIGTELSNGMIAYRYD